MQSHSRSREATFTFKSCKNRSIETKQQSAMRSTPKSKQDGKKTKAKCAKSKKPAVKSANKLNQLTAKIARKLESFQGESAIVTLSTTTNASSNRRSGLVDGPRLQMSSSTNSIYQRIVKDQSQLDSVQPEAEPRVNEDREPSKYQTVFEMALSRPNCLKSMKMRRRNIVDKYSRQHTLVEEVKEYRKQQNENWRSINRELMKYLSVEREEISQHQHRLIKESLQRQGQANYRWVQIQDKMTAEDYQIASTPKCEQVGRAEGEVERADDEPLCQKMVLKNYNWEKYIWGDEVSSTSDLQCNSRIGSEPETEYLHTNFKPEDIVEEANYVQENVDLVLNWILDQFVVELAHKLDFGLLLCPAKTTSYETSASKGHEREDEEYRQFLVTINQISGDCQHVHSFCQDASHNMPVFIRHAFEEVLKEHPALSDLQIRDKLLRAITSREMEASELYPLEDREEEEWIKISLLYELEELIWQGLVMEEACRLWMG